MKKLSTLYFLLLLIASISTKVLAQKTNQAGRNPTQFYTPSSITQSQKDSVLSFKGRQFWLLHHSSPISETQFKEMKAAGIILGTPFSAQTQLASIPASFPISDLPNFGFERISPFTKQQTSESINEAPSSNKTASSSQEYSILALPGIKPEDIEKNWNASWGKLTAIWPGEPSRIQVLAGATELESIQALDGCNG